MRTTIEVMLKHLGLALTACAMLGACGCSQVRRADQANEGEKADIDTFLHQHLQKQAMVTTGEAYRAMLILADGDDTCETFEARREKLEQRSIARPQWGLERDLCIDKGSVAYMVCQILKIQGGINYNLYGKLGSLGDRRYALRELAFLDLMPESVSYRYITGGELVDLMAKADRYMADHGRYQEEKVDISTELSGQRGGSSQAKP